MLNNVPLLELFKRWSGSDVRTIVPLPLSGSSRTYFRITGGTQSAIGVYHEDDAENLAFITFARHFAKKGIPVPEIYATDLEQHIYLQQDLGDVTLFDILQDDEKQNSSHSIPYLEQAVQWLPRIQMEGHVGLDYSIAYPRESFDIQSMRWDLNYFKYHFLKFTGIVFNEQHLENDFETILKSLSQTSRDFFLYRDFQSRNIMVQADKVWFIDFQGGRKGYPAYDLASLLYDAKANISSKDRDDFLALYLKSLPENFGISRADFMKNYPGFVLIRKLQAMGAFGFRGIFERKTHFLQSIPYALRNGKWIMENLTFPFDIPELKRILIKLPDTPFLVKIEEEINSLSL
jgi:aminoglycoside/choline kinase family phosphotransferase